MQFEKHMTKSREDKNDQQNRISAAVSASDESFHLLVSNYTGFNY